MNSFTLDRSAVPKYVASQILFGLADFTFVYLILYILNFGTIRGNYAMFYLITLLPFIIREIWNHRIVKLVFDTDKKMLLLTTRQFLYPEDIEEIPFEKATLVYRLPDTFYIQSGNRDVGNFICEKSLLSPAQIESLLDSARQLSIRVKC